MSSAFDQHAEVLEWLAVLLDRERIRKALGQHLSADDYLRVMEVIQQGWRDIAARELRVEHRMRQRAEGRTEKLLMRLREIRDLPCLPSEPTALVMRKIADRAVLESYS